MATYTSYLNLEKPAVGETFNLLKINQNWDKIDQGVSALNSKTSRTVTANSLSALESNLVSIANSMGDQNTVSGYIYPNFSDNEKGFSGTPGSYTISRRGDGIYVVHIWLGASEAVGYYYSSTWHWDGIAMNSNIANWQVAFTDNTTITGMTVAGYKNTGLKLGLIRIVGTSTNTPAGRYVINFPSGFRLFNNNISMLNSLYVPVNDVKAHGYIDVAYSAVSINIAVDSTWVAGNVMFPIQ